MKKLSLVLVLVLVLALPARAANTISSTNIAWRTNVAAEADLMLAENTNRPSPFKTIAVTVANLFSNRVASGTWSFSGATVTGLSSLSAFATNVFTNGFWSGYVSAQGRTGATNAPFRWNNTNGTAILSFETNNTILPASDNVITLGKNGNNLASVASYQYIVGNSGNGDVKLTPLGTIGYLHFSRIDGGSSSGIAMDGGTGAKLNFPNAGGVYTFLHNDKIVDLYAAGLRLNNTNGIQFSSFVKSSTAGSLSNPDALIRAYSNSTIVVSGTNGLGAAALPTGSIVASNVFLVGRQEMAGANSSFVSVSNSLSYNRAPFQRAADGFAWTIGADVVAPSNRTLITFWATNYVPPSADVTVELATDYTTPGTPDLGVGGFKIDSGTMGGALREVRCVQAWIQPGGTFRLNVTTNSGAAVSLSTYHRSQF